MAIGIIRDNSVIGIKTESTEGTYAAPSSASVDYMQPLKSGWEFKPVSPDVSRNVLSASIGMPTPRKGMQSCSAVIPVEMKASGVEGTAPNSDLLWKTALGGARQIGTAVTTKGSGNTGSTLAIQDADISSLNVGDCIVIKETGAYWPCAITAKTTGAGTATVTVSPPRATSTFPNSVVIAKSNMYYTAPSGHPALSLSFYYGNVKCYKGIGMKVNALSIDNFQTGALASAKFGLQGLNWATGAGAAPNTPVYDAGIPPIILNAKLFKGSTEFKINKYSLNLSNTISSIDETASSNGAVALRVTDRTVKGTLDPYFDDTLTTWSDLLANGNEFSLFISAYIPDSANAGQGLLGSYVSIWLPQVIVNEHHVADAKGILSDEVSFQATRGSDGTHEEMYVGMI